MRNENEPSSEQALRSPVPVPKGTSVGTGDPNPKGYRDTTGTITTLTVKAGGTATFTVEEIFTGADKDALSAYTFLLTCDPAFATFVIPTNDYRPWTTQDGVALGPGDKSPRIQLQDPNQQKLNKANPRVFCDIQLEAEKTGTTKVLFNADVTGENTGDNKPIVKAKFPTPLVVTIV